ncbi:MAG TPA: TonB-dependent receptor plug domain-containing protein, partial [Reyranella sp.]|nr:TonB-dependent receptor plug domain-containing protein [Reyranella sp.]
MHPLVVALAALLPLSAAAQDAAPARDAVVLDALQVTAQRRVENAKDVPVSISAIQGEKLDILGSAGDDIRFLSARVPSLNIESSYGRAFPRFYIRGLGNTDFDLNASQPVSLVYDDVVQESPLLKGFPLFDLAGVEVLRGPQGTLFGRNTPAGVVKFDSARPSQDADGYLKVAYGSYDTWNVQGAYGGPLTDKWSARVSALYQRRDDWFTNTRANTPSQGFEGYDEYALRGQLLFTPTPEFTALLGAHVMHLDGTPQIFRANIIKPGSNDLVDGFDERKISIDGRNEQSLDSNGASMRLRWDWDGR